MRKEPDPLQVAAALQVSIGLFIRRLRHAPVQEEVTMSEMSALGRLDRAGPVTPGRLARAEQISPQAIGVILNGLAERGLVERHPDPGDRRRTLMSLTEAGRRVVRGKRTARAEQLAKVLAAGFTREELRILMAAAPLIERLGEGLR
jgi:DNA-binding MarR family transcriptional regulator